MSEEIDSKIRVSCLGNKLSYSILTYISLCLSLSQLKGEADSSADSHLSGSSKIVI